MELAVPLTSNIYSIIANNIANNITNTVNRYVVVCWPYLALYLCRFFVLPPLHPLTAAPRQSKDTVSEQ